MINARLARVRERMKAHGLEQVIVTQPQGIYYLTDQWVNPHDRLDALVVTPEACRMLCYNLAVIEPADCEVSVYSDTGETVRRLSALLESRPTGVDGYFHSRFLLPLMALRPGLTLSVSTCVEEARMFKEPDEIARLRVASEVTDRVFAAAFAQLREGMTELELGAVFSDCFAAEGVGRFEGDPMVCFGAGSAEPHHAPGSAPLRPGDAVCVDTGKRINGYYSDMTRTVFFRSASDEQRRVYDVVLEANLAALSAVRPGRSSPRSIRPPWTSSAAPATATSIPIAPATASASTTTRSPSTSPAARCPFRRACASPSSPASTCPAASACASRIWWSSPPTAAACSTTPPRR